MLRVIFFALFCGTLAENKLYYENFSGDVISEEEYAKYEEANKTFWCAGTYKPCDEDEGRRLDTTCNNLDFPTRGPPQTPFIRDLPAYYDDGYQPVKQRCGQEMPNARKMRTVLLPDGAIPDQTFTILFAYYMLFMASQTTSFHDSINFIKWKPYCCNAGGKHDPQCNPLKIPADDTVHQFSGIRCFNHTWPITFQNVGCIKNDSIPPQRITSSSVFFDMSIVYGFDGKYRAKEDGLLQVEEVGGIVWPVSHDEETSKEVCFMNNRPQETLCFARSPNSLFPVTFLGMHFYKMHNHIAKELKRVNPGWDDDKLFEKARDINIAFSLEVFFYELLPSFMGTRNLVQDEVITEHKGFRDIYDKDLPPQQSEEFSYVMRWGHTIQPGQIRLYDTEGNYCKQMPVGNMSMRTGIFTVDNNLEGMTQGAFRQAGAKIDHIVDPFVAQTGLGGMQKAFDLPAADLAKAGMLGIRPYVDYRELCTGKKYKYFKDLARDIIPENLERLEQNYKHYRDVPLLAGIWMEKLYPGSFAPRTVYCLLVKYLKTSVKFDRHWYERPNRPNAFSKAQLYEIRKSRISRMFCDVGHSVTHIQPSAFLRAGPRNKMVTCKNIPNINYEAWADNSN